MLQVLPPPPDMAQWIDGAVIVGVAVAEFCARGGSDVALPGEKIVAVDVAIVVEVGVEFRLR